MKREFYIFIFLISILFVFSCSSSMRSINEHLSDKGLLASYQKEADLQVMSSLRIARS